ncbi:energy-coupling factor transporter transmembrane component T family protein [Bacillus glycinifermentans]|uniref:Cobalt transporter n=1 Tax=Bacillus glycinifermentans TaxID=1664069 RepID=A0A0T6BJH2_9BACI|nr:energy-coupling factor transporter transmembrane component T [Bacillus glycinifermentans]ATH93791.1 energy-coupling factor transporter transmembrane protein EcfT [Bacillus glycinifermentans]KRT90031.1 cobalt transporter [Bacillus glycinifermentans]MEC0483710.1 energy-coupling factor transporter transmembrane component T [Bacillus glycinifermentans]MEC0496205.1 energy-coupling factor transporter transmembrane component T [Bacillus glycinifermentans]MEC0539483.1 energy-coupling factor transpo
MKSNDSYLSTLNPAGKLFFHLLVMCILMTVSNPKPTFFIWLLAVMTGIVFGGWTAAYLAKRLLPYLLFFVLVCWMMAAFGKGEETLWQWAWFHVTKESLGNGLTIALRMLGFVTYGLLFTSTTDLTSFIMSLIHQCRLSPKWAYGLLAGFRFVPLFQSELSQMKAAHKIRGYKQKNSWKAFIAYSLPLFSQGIRKSERIAVAMEARGFTGTRDRTYYQTPRLGAKDALYGTVLLLAVLAILIVFSK